MRNKRKVTACTLKPGDRVRMVNCQEAESHPGQVWTVRSDPWEVCGSVCVLLEGISGGVDVERLERVEG